MDGGIDFVFDGGVVVFEEVVGFVEIEEGFDVEVVVVVLYECGGEDEFGLNVCEWVGLEGRGGVGLGFVVLIINECLLVVMEEDVVLGV